MVPGICGAVWVPCGGNLGLICMTLAFGGTPPDVVFGGGSELKMPLGCRPGKPPWTRPDPRLHAGGLVMSLGNPLPSTELVRNPSLLLISSRYLERMFSQLVVGSCHSPADFQRGLASVEARFLPTLAGVESLYGDLAVTWPGRSLAFQASSCCPSLSLTLYHSVAIQTHRGTCWIRAGLVRSSCHLLMFLQAWKHLVLVLFSQVPWWNLLVCPACEKLPAKA